MPNAGQLARHVVRYGAKYGPALFEVVKHGREPAQHAVQRSLERQGLRRRAFQHAAITVDGAVLRVFYQGCPVWVVFSAETPIASHPPDVAPLEELIAHADVTQRVHPRSGGVPLPGFARRILRR